MAAAINAFSEGYDSVQDARLRRQQMEALRQQQTGDAAAGAAIFGGSAGSPSGSGGILQSILRKFMGDDAPPGAQSRGLPPLKPGQKLDLETLTERINQAMPTATPQAKMQALQSALPLMNAQALQQYRMSGLEERIRHDQTGEGLGRARIGVSEGNLGERQRHDQVNEGLGQGRLGVAQGGLDERTRHDQAGEATSAGSLGERTRHDQASEGLGRDRLDASNSRYAEQHKLLVQKLEFAKTNAQRQEILKELKATQANAFKEIDTQLNARRAGLSPDEAKDLASQAAKIKQGLVDQTDQALKASRSTAVSPIEGTGTDALPATTSSGPAPAGSPPPALAPAGGGQPPLPSPQMGAAPRPQAGGMGGLKPAPPGVKQAYQKALAAGKPQGALIQRLQQHGFDPASL